MNATIQSVNFTADQKLINFIQKRLDKLEQFNDGIVNGSVFLKVEPDHERGNKKVEMLVHVRGQELMVKKVARTFEAATDLCAEAMRRRLKRQKEKRKITAT